MTKVLIRKLCSVFNLGVAPAIALNGCEEESPVEKTGEKVDCAIKGASKVLKDATSRKRISRHCLSRFRRTVSLSA